MTANGTGLRNRGTMDIKCQVCHAETLTDKRIYPMSGPARLIAYLLLLPYLAGILFCVICFVALAAQPLHERIPARLVALTEMREHGVSEDVVHQVAADPYRDPADYLQVPGFPKTAYGWVKDASQKLRDGGYVEVATQGHALAERRRTEGFYFALGAALLAGALPGWSLVMKKRVLQCETCNAVMER
jgi:hypothetical protein